MSAGMAPLASSPLKHQIDGCQVYYYNVKIEIQTLLGHLGSYKYFRAVPASIFTKDIQNHILARLSSIGRKTRVKKKHFRPIGKPFADTLAIVFQKLAIGEELVKFLGSLHRIDKRQSHSTIDKTFL